MYRSLTHRSQQTHIPRSIPEKVRREETISGGREDQNASWKRDQVESISQNKTVEIFNAGSKSKSICKFNEKVQNI